MKYEFVESERERKKHTFIKERKKQLNSEKEGRKVPNE
jgi:hypothetical protein